MNTHKDDEQRGLLAMIANPPNAVAGLCVIFVSLHIALALIPAGAARQIWRYFELSPKRALRALEAGEFFRVVRTLIGHIFFHVNLAHLLINLAAVLVLGTIVHREMAARAQQRKSDATTAFFGFFLISGMMAGAVFILSVPDSYQPMIGASGAAAGLAGACAWLFVTRTSAGKPSPNALRNLLVLFLVSAALIAASYFLDTSKVSLKLFGSVSAWQAHVGGYVFGLVFYPLFERLAGAAHEPAQR